MISAPKTFLGHSIQGSGFDEVEQALDLIAASPATAHHVSSEIAAYFIGDTPPPALVARMATSFRHGDGDIALPCFARCSGRPNSKPRSARHSRIRPTMRCRRCVLPMAIASILNTDPLSNWLQRMGEGLFAHETPDGYSVAPSAWSGPGQMETRFEIARSIGGGSAGLFKPRDGSAPELPAFPQIQNALFFQSLQQQLSPSTTNVLAQAALAAGVERALSLLPRIHAPLKPKEMDAMHRRDLLRAAAAFAPMVVAGRAFAAPAAGSGKLLLVFLRGAYDAANIVAPVGSDFYHQARPTIGLAAAQPGRSRRRAAARRRLGACTRRSRTASIRSGRRSSSPSCRSRAPTT